MYETIDVSTELLNIFKEMHTLFAFILSCCYFRFIAVPIGVMYEWVMHQNWVILFIVSFDASVSNCWVTGKLALWQYRRNRNTSNVRVQWFQRCGSVPFYGIHGRAWKKSIQMILIRTFFFCNQSSSSRWKRSVFFTILI